MALWDTAGQDEYAGIRRLSYRSTDVFVVCFSVVDRSSLENVRVSWLPELRTVTVYQCFSPARRYAGAGTSYGAVSACLSVCLFVCLYIHSCHLATAGASDSSLALDCCARYQVFVCMSATSRCSIKKVARISTIRDAILTCARKPT